MIPALEGLRSLNPDVEYERHGDIWHIDITFGKVQPGATVWTSDELLIGTPDAREVVLSGQVFGDNFEPFSIELRVASDPTIRTMTVKELRAEHDREEKD